MTETADVQLSLIATTLLEQLATEYVGVAFLDDTISGWSCIVWSTGDVTRVLVASRGRKASAMPAITRLPRVDPFGKSRDQVVREAMLEADRLNNQQAQQRRNRKRMKSRRRR